MNIVLMAGGGGTRLWPISRAKTPKQFIDLGDGTTLIQKAYHRAAELTEPANIYVATRQEYAEIIARQLPAINQQNVMLEPEKRDTTAAFALTCLRLKHLGQGSTPTIFMWADHIFSREDAFISDLNKIPLLLESHPDHIVIVGHSTLHPDTALGHLEVGEKMSQFENAFEVRGFIEKPELEKAIQLTGDPRYYWNLGYFSLLPDYLLQELSRLNSDLVPFLKDLEEAVDSGDDSKIANAFNQFPKIALEYTLMEKTSRLLAVTGDYGWSDIGNWNTFKEIFGTAGDHMPRGHHVHVNCDDNYIYNTTDKTVSLIGLKETIVVVTDDAVLVTDKKHAAKVKDVVKKLEQDAKYEVL